MAARTASALKVRLIFFYKTKNEDSNLIAFISEAGEA